jgi:hypothetical protein
MSKVLYDLLAIDEVAQKAGCGLHPRLRAAIKADLSFNAVSAGPHAALDRSNPPDNVAVFPPVRSAERKQA